MKVLLLEDVPKLGKRGEIKEVSDGYARNYLFPRNLAVEATNGYIKHIEENKKIEEKRKQSLKEKSRRNFRKTKRCNCSS